MSPEGPDDRQDEPTPVTDPRYTEPADVHVRLNWDRDLRFRAQAGRWVTEMDGNAEFATSPVQLLLQSVGGCAAVDVVHILRKGKEDVRKLEVQVSGQRADDDPRRLTHITVHFHITGDVDRDAARRAARLSFEKYCSCYHSLRRDIELESRITIHEGEHPPA